MAAIPNRYEPTQRLIDNRRKLARLYFEKDLTICEIADQHSEYEKTTVYEALVDHGILTKNDDQKNCCRGTDPPPDQTKQDVDWTEL